MELSSDTEGKFQTHLAELVKETYDEAYQDEVKMYSEILACYACNQLPGTSTTLRGKRYTKTGSKVNKTPTKRGRSISKNFILPNKNTGTSSSGVDDRLDTMVHSSESTHTIIYNNNDTEETMPKHVTQTDTFVVGNTTQDVFVNTNEDHEPKYLEKMTYCRPVLNMYNQEFIYKTMERNIKLQRLVKQLVEARAKEKHHEAWNNYINDLKNKHKYQSEVEKLHSNIPDDPNPEIIDYYNTKYAWKQSNPCQNLLQDFYSASNVNSTNEYNRCSRGFDFSNYKHYKFHNDAHCYPTASQSRVLTINNQRENGQQPSRYYRGSTIIVDNEYNQYISRPQYRRPLDNDKRNMINLLRSFPAQTESDFFAPIPREERSSMWREKYNFVQSNVEKLKHKIMGTKSSKVSLNNIENKLDSLIESLNTFITEIRNKKIATSEQSTGSSLHCSFADNTTELEKQHINFGNTKYTCGILQEQPLPGRGFLAKNSIDNIIYEEMNKSDKIKRDIDELLSSPQNPCAVKILFDIPTKEISTEITNSLSKNLQNTSFTVEDLSNPDADRITIAVNTEPLGISALIRVSTETVKQLLSYMPQIDYVSYLSRLQFNQVATRPRLSGFECSICGATFDRSSLLSDHIIGQHNLSTKRDCCLCRHTLEMKQKRLGLFKCHYCGQRFTRAYCRELHEQECARQLGRVHDVSSSLIMLT